MTDSEGIWQLPAAFRRSLAASGSFGACLASLAASEDVQQLLAAFGALDGICQLPAASDGFVGHLTASGCFRRHLEPSVGF